MMTAVGIAVMAVRISGCDGLVGLTDESGVWYWLKQQRSPSSASSGSSSLQTLQRC